MSNAEARLVHCCWCGKSGQVQPGVSRPIGWEQVGTRIYCGACVAKLMGEAS